MAYKVEIISRNSGQMTIGKMHLTLQFHRNIGFKGPANKQELLTSVCKTETKATAAKIIRIPDAEHIINLINQYKSDIDGKIIILVRDPRAMITSRRKIAMWDGLWKRDRESMLMQLKKECRMMSKNKDLAKSYPG